VSSTGSRAKRKSIIPIKLFYLYCTKKKKHLVKERVQYIFIPYNPESVVTKEQGRKAFSFSRYRAKEINEKENQQKKEQKRKSH